MVLGLWKLICTTNPLREKQPHKVTLNFNDHLKKNVIYQKLGKHFATYNLNAELWYYIYSDLSDSFEIAGKFSHTENRRAISYSVC